MKKTVVELFAGVGGFRVGLNNIKSFNPETGLAEENEKWKFVWANQWEPSTKIQPAYDCYVTRFGEDNVSNTDIALVDKTQIPDHNLLVGGFPCQDYSVARTKSNEKGIQGKKGVLFWEISETLEKKNTPFFLLENVDRLLKTPANQRGRDFGIMLRTLSDLGYNMEWRIINAADYGRGQRRRRVFIFGWKKHLNYNQYLNEYSPEKIMLEKSMLAKSFPLDAEKTSNFKKDNLLAYQDTVVMTDEYQFLFENTGVVLNGSVYTFRTEPIRKKAIPLKDNLESGDHLVNYIIPEDRLEKLKKLRRGKRVKRTKPNGETYYYSEGSMSTHDSIDLPARTMLTSEKSTNRSTHVILDPVLKKERYLTPVEAERLQDFPDNWTDTGMSESRRYFMMGNALVTGLISEMEKELSKIFDAEKT